MQTPKKRKRETVHPRITYDAPGRSFDRLFKEDSLEEMKDVIRKKLGVANSVSIHLLQVRHGKSLDLEDDDDFDAFHAYVHAKQSAHVEVVVGLDSEKKEKISNVTVPSSAASSLLVDLPPHKKRRVLFVDPPSDPPEQSIVPAIPEKKKSQHVADSTGPPEGDLVDIGLPSTNEGSEKKKKTKKSLSTHTEDGVNGAETIPETPFTHKAKKRTREEDTPRVLSPSQFKSVADEGDNTSRPAKKSKKKSKETDDEPTSKSLESKEKGTEKGVSEPPGPSVSGSQEQVRHDEASNENRKKGKSKVKGSDTLLVEPSTSSRAKAAEVKKHKVIPAEQTETRLSDSDPHAFLQQIRGLISIEAQKKEKAQATPAAPKDVAPSRDKESSSTLVEKKTGRKGQDPEIIKPGTAQEQSLNRDNSAVTIEVVQAISERQSTPTSESPQVLQAAAPQPTTSEGEELSAQEEEPCLLCDELPSHNRPLCPVIKGGVKTMRKRLSQLEKDTSGNERNQEKRQQAIAELQATIQKRSRKPRTLKADATVPIKKAPVTRKKAPPPASPAPIAEATKTTKQVDVVSPPTRVVDVVPRIAPPQPVKSTTKSLESAKQPSPLQSPPASQPPSSAQKSAAQDKVIKEVNLPLVTEPSLVGLGNPPFEDLSQVTDNDLQSIISGRRVSIADVPSSDEEEEEEEEEEEPFLDDDEPQQEVSRRLSQGPLREYPSSSDAEEEDDDSPEGSVSKGRTTSFPTEEEDSADDRQISEGPSSFREVDTRGSSREIDKTGDNAVEAASVEEFASLNAAINGKGKGAEVDSDTAVGSQVEEIVDPQAKKKKVESTDPIEHSKGPSDEQTDLILSDDADPAPQPTPKVEPVGRTRSQKKKNTEQEEVRVIAPKTTLKKARKITELPLPALPSAQVVRLSPSSITSARRVRAPVQDHEAINLDNDLDDQPPKPSTNGKVGPKASIKDTKRKRSTNTTPRVTSETTKGKSVTKAGSRVSAANGTTSNPKVYKITPTDPIGLAAALNDAAEENNDIGSQWAVLKESNPLMETPGQVDELLSDFTSQTYQTPLMSKQSRDQEPLFLPSETQQSYRYSQASEIFATPGANNAHEPSHESEDENEVVASVVKPADSVRTYRGLSQIASSQTFAKPQFQPAISGKIKEPESLYGRNRREVVSETDSSSESEEDRPVVSHIPASRRAGLNSSSQR